MKEINSATADSDALTDAIDEALFGKDEEEAVVLTAAGKPFAAFKLGGDGNYDVVKGTDALGAVCALSVVV